MAIPRNSGAKPVKKAVAKKSSVPAKKTAAKKPAVKKAVASKTVKKNVVVRGPEGPSNRGGPGSPGKNMSKGAMNPVSMDKAYNAHKKTITTTRAEIKQLYEAMNNNPLGRVFKGQFGKYDGEITKRENMLMDLRKQDNQFMKNGYRPLLSEVKRKKR